ncbi:MAG TPA: aldehyde dehydrogenase family protein, partial [Acidimicrobiia bacterium]|nr:aldehyde dehydrogenase family protein [Acidimicrobiia bacterium]
ITYATMSADNEELNSAYEKALADVQSKLGQTHGVIVDGESRIEREMYEERSPMDSDLVVGRYAQATNEDIDDAVAAADAFQPEWEGIGWEARRDLMMKAADLMQEQVFDLAALISYEVAKNRLEALGDAQETIDFLRYYSRQITENNGFVTDLSSLSDDEKNVSVLRPFGVWAVISPFNFPLALSGGPSIGALITGNTVVVKPSNAGALMALEFHRVMTEAGLPEGALHIVTGGDEAGDYLAHHDDVDGLTFTGSHEVGMYLYRTVNEKRPKPVTAEMGGKNPAIVTKTADLDVAAEGIARGAFGFSGQKCSATSRVYVEDDVYDEFVDKLVARTQDLKVGIPTENGVFVGPVIDQDAVERFKEAVAEVESKGGSVLAGGKVRDDDDFARGNYVEPTVVSAPLESWVWDKELFVPFVTVSKVSDLEEGLRLSNDTPFGLTAGLFSGDDDEIERWFSGIEAGVTYVNRAAGATTGAWPDVQSFGGWKGSGTSGAGGGGPWYLRQFLREQSRTLIG